MANCCCWRNPTRKDCCVTSPGPCLVGEDDFDRANSTELGPKWCEETGDAEILNNTLNLVTEGLVLTTYRQPPPVVPGASYNHRFQMVMDSAGNTEEWHFVMNVVDEDNYHWIKVAKDAGIGDGRFYPTFYRRVNGSDTEIMSINTHPQGGGWDLENGKLRVNICMADVGWSIEPTDNQGQSSWTTCDAEAVERLPKNQCYGLVGVKKGRFDDFFYYVHWESQRDCAYCNCLCFLGDEDVSCFPEEMLLTLVPTSGPFCWTGGTPGCCDQPSSLSVTLYQQIPDTSGPSPAFGAAYKTPTKRIWWSELLTGDGGSDMVPDKTYFEFGCEFAGSSGTTRSYLSIWRYPLDPILSGGTARFDPADQSINPNNANTKMFDLSRSTCDPLSLVFPDIKFPRDSATPDQCWVNAEYYEAILTVSP